MTPIDIIKLALKNVGVLGVGQTPSAEDMNDAFTYLNAMVGQWNRRGWLVYHLIEVSKVATGALAYSVGPGGDFDVPRVTQIEAAFVRQVYQPTPNQVDTPLAIIESYDDYATIGLKSQAGFPQMVFLDSGNPLGNLYVWPVPGSMYEIHLILRAALPGFVAVTDDVTLPAEYQEAILYNLAARLRPSYGLGPDPSVTALARSSLNTIRNANTQVPLLRMPDNLVRPSLYNVYSDRTG